MTRSRAPTHADKTQFLIRVCRRPSAFAGEPLLSPQSSLRTKAGRLEEARDHLQKAKRADGRNPDIWYDLGITLAMMKKAKQARSCFRRVLQLDANYFWAWYDLACLDALEKRPDAAFRKLYKSVECGFRNADYLLKDSDFKGIRKDPRWRLVLDCISDRAKIENEATD